MKTKRFRDLSKIKKVSLIFSIILVIYTIFSSVYIVSILNSINQTLESIRLPNGYYAWNFGTSNPSFKISFGIENKGLFEVRELKIGLTLDLSFYDLNKNQSFREQFFQKQEDIGIVNPLFILNYTIDADSSSFNINVLDSFWNNISNYTNIYYLMNVSISLNLLNGFIPSAISYRNLNLLMLECINCN